MKMAFLARTSLYPQAKQISNDDVLSGFDVYVLRSGKHDVFLAHRSMFSNRPDDEREYPRISDF